MKFGLNFLIMKKIQVTTNLFIKRKLVLTRHNIIILKKVKRGTIIFNNKVIYKS